MPPASAAGPWLAMMRALTISTGLHAVPAQQAGGKVGGGGSAANAAATAWPGRWWPAGTPSRSVLGHTPRSSEARPRRAPSSVKRHEQQPAQANLLGGRQSLLRASLEHVVDGKPCGRICSCVGTYQPGMHSRARGGSKPCPRRLAESCRSASQIKSIPSPPPCGGTKRHTPEYMAKMPTRTGISISALPTRHCSHRGNTPSCRTMPARVFSMPARGVLATVCNRTLIRSLMSPFSPRRHRAHCIDWMRRAKIVDEYTQRQDNWRFRQTRAGAGPEGHCWPFVGVTVTNGKIQM